MEKDFTIFKMLVVTKAEYGPFLLCEKQCNRVRDVCWEGKCYTVLFLRPISLEWGGLEGALG